MRLSKRLPLTAPPRPLAPVAEESPPSAGGGAAEIAPAVQNLRMLATLLVLLAHSAIAYVQTPLRTTLWSAYDPKSSPFFDALAYWVNGFAMPLFFLIAGISAPAACASRGPAVFVKHRARRLLIPFALALGAILPLSYFAYGMGLLSTEQISMNDILRMRFEPSVQQQLYGPMHLWFLEYLFLVCVCWAGLRSLCDRVLSASTRHVWHSACERILASRFKPLLVAIPTGLILLCDADVFLRLNNSYLPDPLRVAHYLVFFAVGASTGASTAPRRSLERLAGWNCVAALTVFSGFLPLILDHMRAPIAQPTRSLLAVGAATFTWLILFGLSGGCCRFLNRQGPILRYMSEASFWIYLIHLPIVLLCQWLLLDADWPVANKFAAVVAITLLISLTSYQWVVRYSLIGKLINGARKRTSWRRRWTPELGWVGIAAFSIAFACGCLWYFKGLIWYQGFAEVKPREVFRSARLSTEQLRHAIDLHGIRSVLSVAGHVTEARLSEQRELCRSRGVDWLWIDLAAESPPRPDQIAELASMLARCPRPVLIEGHRGLGRAGFGAAIAILVDGGSPEAALEQFHLRFGQLGGAKRSVFAKVIAQYDEFLLSTEGKSSPERFLAWATLQYPEERPTMLAHRAGRDAVSPRVSVVDRAQMARRRGISPR